MTDQLLLEQCANGNRLAQRQMYERYAGRLFATCLRYLSREDAEEAHSNAWIKVFQNVVHFRGESKLSTWMTRITVNECLMMLRKKNIFFQEMEDEMFEQVAGYVDDSDVEQLLQLVSELPVGYRTVFNLYAIEGYSHKEIAEMLRISEGTSKSQLARARDILRKGVEERVFTN